LTKTGNQFSVIIRISNCLDEMQAFGMKNPPK